jgi:hypothetical protein
MSDTAIIGHRTQFGFTALGASLPLTRRVALERCGVAKIPSLIEPESQMRGTIFRDSESVSAGTYTVGGAIQWNPRPDELYDLMPLILNGSWSGGGPYTMSPALLVDGFYFGQDLVRKVYTYDGMKVVRAVFASAAGQQLSLSLDMEGLTETEGNAGTFPTLALSVQPPMTHAMAALVLNTHTHYTENVAVTIENPVNGTRFFNSLSRTEVPVLDNIIRLAITPPYTANAITDFYKIPLGGIAGYVVWTNGNYQLRFDFDCLQASPRNPESGGKTAELMLPVEFIARTKSGGSYTGGVRVTLNKTA